MYDRTYLDGTLFDRVINGPIKENNILGLYKDHNIKLYMYAFALGYNSGEMNPSIHRRDYARDESTLNVYPEAISFMRAVYISSLLESNEKVSIEDNEPAYDMAEKYVNKGLSIIEEESKNSDDEAIMFAALRKLDKKYEELFGESK